MNGVPLIDTVRDLIDRGEIHTWSDGYGIWHARVKSTYAFPRGAALAAIWRELKDRGDTRTHEVPRPQIERVPDLDTEGHHVYREKD